MALAGAILAPMILGGCGLGGGTLGGRHACWDPSEQRIASLMKGTLRLDPAASSLETPEGDVLALAFAGPGVAANGDRLAVVDGGGGTVALDGELVTVFGGLGADASMVVCGVEERHAAP